MTPIPDHPTPPPTCVCGHVRGDHRYNGARFTGSPQNVDCRQCDCRLFVDERDAKAAAA